MSHRIDLTGIVFDRLTVLRKDDARTGYWLCRCQCGTSIRGQSLHCGMTKSCGCLRREQLRLCAGRSRRSLAADRAGKPRCHCVGERKPNGRMCVSCFNRFSNYRITPTEFFAMVDRQAGLCAICCEPMSPKKGTHVDHCHHTNVVRGLLCSNCNTGIGLFGDDASLIAVAIQYLANVA